MKQVLQILDFHELIMPKKSSSPQKENHDHIFCIQDLTLTTINLSITISI